MADTNKEIDYNSLPDISKEINYNDLPDIVSEKKNSTPGLSPLAPTTSDSGTGASEQGDFQNTLAPPINNKLTQNIQESFSKDSASKKVIDTSKIVDPGGGDKSSQQQSFERDYEENFQKMLVSPETREALQNIIPKPIESSYRYGSVKAFNEGLIHHILKPLDGAATMIADLTGMEKGGGFGDAANGLTEVNERLREMPDTFTGKVAGGVSSTIPLLMGLFVTKGAGSASLPVNMAATGFLNSYQDKSEWSNATIGEKVSESIEPAIIGGAEGVIFHSLGLGSNVIGEMVSKMGAGKLLTGATAAAANSVMFGGYDALRQFAETGKVDLEQAAASAGVGLALSGPQLVRAMAESAASKAQSNFFDSPSDLVNNINKTEKTVTELRDESIKAGEQAENETDTTKKNELLLVQRGLDKAADIKAVTENIVKNPNEFIEAIKSNPELSPEAKKELLDKVHKTVADNDPKIKEANVIKNQIQVENDKIASIDENEFVDPIVKEAQKRSIEENVKELNVKLQDLFKAPENTAPKEVKATNTEEQVPAVKKETVIPEEVVTPNIPEQGAAVESAAPPVEIAPTEAPLEKPSEENTTGIKNEVVERERAERGLPPVEVLQKRSFPDVVKKAKEMISSGEIDPRSLAEQLSKKPRAINAEESWALDNDRMELSNQHKAVSQQIIDATASGNEILASEARIRLAKIEHDTNINDEASTRVGYEQGLGLAFRRAMIREDYSLANLIQKARVANNGKDISPDTRVRLEKLSKDLDAANARADAHEERLSQLEAEKLFKKTKSEADHEKRTTKRTVTKERLKTERDSLINQLQEIAKKSRGQASANAVPVEMIPVLSRLMKNYVMDGVNTLDGVIDNMYLDMKEHVDGLTKRDLRDALSGYGKIKKISKEAIDVELRDLKAQARLTSALEDAMSGERPLKSGLERDKPSDKVRDLQKKVGQAMRENGIQIESTKSQEDIWRSALDAIKTRLRNNITDLQNQIETGEKTPKKAGVEYDAEAMSLKAKRDELKSTLEEIEGKPEMSDEQRVKIATNSVEKSIKEYERRINEGDFSPSKKTESIETPELKTLREKRDELKLDLEKLKEAASPKKTPEEIAIQKYKTMVSNRILKLEEKISKGDYEKTPKKSTILDAEAMSLKAKAEKIKMSIDAEVRKIAFNNRTITEKTLDYATKWRRAVILSSVVTLGKLTMAAVGRTITTPIEEIVGHGLSKIPGISKISKMAPREGGGFSAEAESKAISKLFEKSTYADALSTAKTGQSELDLLYGKKADMPSSALEFFGHLHGALKTPVKKSEFFRSFEKRIEFAIKNGKDVSDPVVQATIASESYMDANRAIFMQQNIVASAHNMAIRYLEGKGDKGKGLAAAVKILLPIVKVPVNFVAEQSSFLIGGAKAAIALRKGVESLNPDQADYVMRALKKQSIGAAVLAIGYFNADNIGGYYQKGEKRKEGDLKPHDLNILGMHVPHWAQHIPLFEILQMGATLKRVQDQYSEKGKDGGTAAGIGNATMGMLKEVPFFETTGQLYNALETPEGRERWVAELSKSLSIPPDVQRIAKYFDTLDGEEIKRKPDGFIDVIKLGIPGLRQQVHSQVELIMAKRAEKNVEKTDAEIEAEDILSEEKQIEKQQKEESLQKLTNQLGIKYLDENGNEVE